MRRVLLTGASGFIGRHCIQPLQSRGYEVHAVAFTTPMTGARDGVTWHQLDLHDAVRTSRLIDEVGPSHLLHLGWSFGPGGADSAKPGACPDHFRWTQATLQLVRAFREAGGERVVAGGTSFEYDWTGGCCSESSTPRRPTSYYGTCKNALFELLSGYSDQVGLRFAWPRIFFLYGPYEPPSRLISSVIRNLLSEQPALCSPGNQIRDYLYVQDVAEAVVAILDGDVQGAINVGSQEPIALRTLITRAAELIGRPDLVRLGALPMRPTDAPLVLADTTRLRLEVGWQPRFSVDSGLAESIAFWRAQLEARTV
jgi:nucleoside-diphosphate-sugar epimerase